MRRKIAQRSGLDEVVERYSVSIICKGSYIPPNKTTSSYATYAASTLGGGGKSKGAPDMLMLGYSGMTTKPSAALGAIAALNVASGDSFKTMNEKKLFLLIEGGSEMRVRQAKVELQRMLDEELVRVSGVGGSGSSGSGGGRYSVV